MGRRRGAYETVAGHTYNIACEYDKLSRLTSYSISGNYALSRSFTYDDTGNRTDSGFSYDEFDVGVNTDILATDGTFTYGFDNNGNLVSKTGAPGVWTYTYDPDNRLRTVEIAAGGQTKTVNYWYDPMGNLVKRSCTIGSQTTTTDYTVDIAQGLPVVLIEQISGGETILYTYGEDLLKVSKDGDYYYFYDGLGSTRTITSGAGGTVVAEYLYDAYGTQLLTGQPTWNTRLFTGESRDPDTGLIYLRARWYDPGTGRFVSRDTYEGSTDEPLSQHRYLYCSDNPVNLTDPSGQTSYADVTSAMAVVSTLATRYASVVIRAGQQAAQTLGRAGTGFAHVSSSVLHRFGTGTVSGVGRFMQRYQNVEIGDWGTSLYYRRVFFDAFSRIPQVLNGIRNICHHRIPQEWRHIPGIGSRIVDRLSNIRLVPENIHVDKINRAWDEFRLLYEALGRNPTAQEVIRKAEEIDRLYSKYFIDPRNYGY